MGTTESESELSSSSCECLAFVLNVAIQALCHSAGWGSTRSNQTIGRALFHDDSNLMDISSGAVVKHTGGSGVSFGDISLKITCFHLNF